MQTPGYFLALIPALICFVDYQSTAIGILRNKASSEGARFFEERANCVSSRSQYFSLSNKIIFGGRALLKIVKVAQSSFLIF